jgi:hypothetical protein
MAIKSRLLLWDAIADSFDDSATDLRTPQPLES